MEALTPEEERLARIVEASLRGEDIRRIMITKAPHSVRGLMAYADVRLEDLLKTLVELKFCEDFESGALDHLPDFDKKQNIAERCLGGLKYALQYYKNNWRT